MFRSFLRIIKNSNETYKHQVGQVSPPRLRVSPAKDDIPEKLFLSTSLPQPLESEIYDNQGVLETWNQQDLESTQKMKNKLEDQRKDSISSIKKPTSPFRRLSSPLTRSGRLSIASITSKFSRKSVDMGGETVNLMASPATSPTDNQPPSLNLGSNTTGEHTENLIVEHMFVMSTILHLKNSTWLPSCHEYPLVLQWYSF